MALSVRRSVARPYHGIALVLAACACSEPRSEARVAATEATPTVSVEPATIEVATIQPPELAAPTISVPPATTELATTRGERRPAPAPRRSLAARRYLDFAAACEDGPTAVIAAVGDLLLHPELQIQALAARERYRVLWRRVERLLARADVTYANLEGPIARGVTRQRELVRDPGLRFDDRVYTGFPQFNYHPALVDGLVASGVDVVSTANNHSLDRGALGVDLTIDALEEGGLRYTGTRRRGDARSAWHTITEANGIRVAWVACAQHTNSARDEEGQVLRCEGSGEGEGEAAPDPAVEVVSALAADREVDAVIVTPHWGREYEPVPGRREVRLARRFFEAGALAVIGSHPHVLQRWDRGSLPDGREGFVIYSLGNFASHQRELPQRTSIVLYLGLRRGEDGVVRLYGARYVPIHVRMEARTEGELERFFVEPLLRAGPEEEERQHIVDIFGAANLLEPRGPLQLAPHCRRARRRAAH